MNQQEILAAARTMINSIEDSFVMGTVSPEGKPHVFYMGAMVFEEPFTIYLESFSDSDKVRHIGQNPNVQIVIAAPDYSQILSISGTAGIETSRDIKKRVWDNISMSGMYFSSPDNPDFCIIKIKAETVALQLATDNPREIHVAKV